EVTAALDGRNISGRYLLLEAVNLPYVGPNLHLAHDSQPGDGQFDVVLVSEDERERLLYYLEHWQENRERLGMLPTLRGRRLQIEWPGFALHIDDQLQREADGDGREALRRARVGRAEDDHQEHERHHRFGDERRAERIAPGRVRAVAVGGEAARQIEARLAAGDEVQQCRCHDGAEHLR